MVSWEPSDRGFLNFQVMQRCFEQVEGVGEVSILSADVEYDLDWVNEPARRTVLQCFYLI